MQYDVVVVGAGPAGLCFARALAGSGMRMAIVERLDEAVLKNPPDDGREIAITHQSRDSLVDLGLWSRLRDGEIGILRDAQVIDGDQREGLMFRHDEIGKSQLGWLLPNNAIRRAAYAQVEQLPDVRIIAGTSVTAMTIGSAGVELELDAGERLQADMVVAADSRFSSLRRMAGISADMHDFGKQMLVLRMQHEDSHDHVAWEWFAYGQTLAVLPLNDMHTSSIVVTLPQQQMQALLALDDAALGVEMARRFQQRLGTMQVAGPRCAYPLVGVYARRFVADRFAVIGDAAVGMHPVTAHGFNFGLLSVQILARELNAAAANGQPIWNPARLQRYEREHRRATWPLYRTTQFLATLYTDDRRPTRVLRKMALGAATHLPPIRRVISARLAQPGYTGASPVRRVSRMIRQLLP